MKEKTVRFLRTFIAPFLVLSQWQRINNKYDKPRGKGV